MDEGRAILALGDGTYIATGKYRLHPKKDFDIFLAHLSSDFELISIQSFGGPLQDEGMWLEPTRDGGFILAGYAFEKEGGFGRHDIYLLKFAANLQLEWERLHGRPFREIPFCIRESEDGYVIGGYTKSQGKNGDFFLLGIDPVGNALWDHYYEAPFVDFGHSLATTKDGYLLIGSTSGYYFPSQANHHYSDSNIMLIKTDREGNELERKYLGGERHEFARALSKAENGWFIFGSRQSVEKGDFNWMLLYLDQELNEKWSMEYGSTGTDQGTAMIPGENSLLLAGTFEVNGKYQARILEVDLAGKTIDEKSWDLNEDAFMQGLTHAKEKGSIGIGYTILNNQNHDPVIFFQAKD